MFPRTGLSQQKCPPWPVVQRQVLIRGRSRAWNCLDGVQCDYAGDTSHRYPQMKEAAKQTMTSTCSAVDGSEGLSEEQARSCFLVNCGPTNFVVVVGNLELRETGVSRANVCVPAASNGPLINFVVAAFPF